MPTVGKRDEETFIGVMTRHGKLSSDFDPRESLPSSEICLLKKKLEDVGLNVSVASSLEQVRIITPLIRRLMSEKHVVLIPRSPSTLPLFEAAYSQQDIVIIHKDNFLATLFDTTSTFLSIINMVSHFNDICLLCNEPLDLSKQEADSVLRSSLEDAHRNCPELPDAGKQRLAWNDLMSKVPFACFQCGLRSHYNCINKYVDQCFACPRCGLLLYPSSCGRVGCELQRVC